MKKVINSPVDRGESPDLMEPLLIGESSNHRAELTDLALELVSCATGFRRSLPDGVLRSLADLVRSMNCYYSNLIEGHDTHPVDIERGVVLSDSQRAPLRLAFPAELAPRWMPGLFPDSR